MTPIMHAEISSPMKTVRKTNGSAISVPYEYTITGGIINVFDISVGSVAEMRLFTVFDFPLDMR
jgi:hypothetical protein